MHNRKPSTFATQSETEKDTARPFAHRAVPHPDRARQFMPFAALKGFDELVREQERLAALQYESHEENES